MTKGWQEGPGLEDELIMHMPTRSWLCDCGKLNRKSWVRCCSCRGPMDAGLKLWEEQPRIWRYWNARGIDMLEGK